MWVQEKIVWPIGWTNLLILITINITTSKCITVYKISSNCRFYGLHLNFLTKIKVTVLYINILIFQGVHILEIHAGKHILSEKVNEFFKIRVKVRDILKLEGENDFDYPQRGYVGGGKDCVSVSPLLSAVITSVLFTFKNLPYPIDLSKRQESLTFLCAYAYLHKTVSVNPRLYHIVLLFMLLLCYITTE